MVIAVPFILFFTRSPVLVVTDTLLTAMYSRSYLGRQQVHVSLGLFRQVKPVIVADGASPDMVSFAIAELSSRPFCVLFARSQASAAAFYHEQFLEIPAVLLSGPAPVTGLPSPDGVLCVYRTDRETDLYRAGLFAGIIGAAAQKPEQQAEDQGTITGYTQRKYVLWHDYDVQPAEKEVFSRGIREQDPEASAVFIRDAAEMPDSSGISCMALVGAGADYIEKNQVIPLILFGWIGPSLSAREVLVQFDDSVWALVIPAVRMATSGQAEGKIPSKPLISPQKFAENKMSDVYKILKDLTEKIP